MGAPLRHDSEQNYLQRQEVGEVCCLCTASVNYAVQQPPTFKIGAVESEGNRFLKRSQQRRSAACKLVWLLAVFSGVVFGFERKREFIRNCDCESHWSLRARAQ